MVTATFAVLGMIAIPTEVSASDPFYECITQHCYAIAAAQNNYYGVDDNFTDKALTVPSSEVDIGGHLSNEVWLLTRQTGTVQWIETGASRGCSIFTTGTPTCTAEGGTSKYLQFWADVDTSGSFFFHVISASASRDGLNHDYEIFNQSGTGNDYQVFLDFNQVGTSADQIHPSGSLIQSGMELSAPAGINSGENSDEFVNTVSVFRVGGSTFVPSQLDTGTVHDFSDPTCGNSSNCAMDPCSEFMQGQCLFWSLSNTNNWSDQKP